MDPYQLWTFLVDPYARSLPLNWTEIAPEGGLATIIAEMVLWACPGDSLFSKRLALSVEMNHFLIGTGPFKYKFDNVKKWSGQHILTLDAVSTWVRETGGHESRLAWWMVNAPESSLFVEIAKPLLSVSITGSMTVERVAKTLKHAVLTEDRAKMATGKSEMLLRCGLNLRFLHETKQDARAKSK